VSRELHSDWDSGITADTMGMGTDTTVTPQARGWYSQ